MNSQGKNWKAYRREDLVYDTQDDLTEILRNDAAFSKRLQCFDVLVTDFVKPSEGDVRKEILQEIMPQAKELLNCIFKKAVDLSFDNQHEKCVGTLEIIRENLQMVLNLLDILDTLLSLVINNNKTDFSYVQAIPLYVGDILYLTFLHCKESKNTYSIYFDSITEILLIFKKAQDVHLKLLKVLESHVNINVSNLKEITLLRDVLDNLVNIGILLSGMNVKAMADNWKGYTNLTQKYNEPLSKIINLKHPLELLTNEILANLKGIFEMDLEDTKTITYTLKVGNFLVKVLSKLCFTFCSNVKSNYDVLWVFLINLYSYTKPSLKQLNCPGEILNYIKSYLVEGVDSIVERLSVEEKFSQTNFDQIKLEPHGYILFLSRLFQFWVKNNVDLYCVDLHLQNVIKCFGCDFILQVDEIHEDLMVYLPIIIVKLNNANFLLIEGILYDHLFDDNVFISIFTQEIWLSIASLTGSKYVFDVLCCLTDKFTPLINSKFTNNIHLYKLSNFLHNLFISLSNEYKMRFTSRYPLRKNLSLWKLINALPPSSKQDIETILFDVTQHIERVLSEECSLEQFLMTVDLLNVTSIIPFEESYFDLKKLSSLLIQLWSFEYNEELFEFPFFDLLLEGMMKLTVSLMWKFNTEELLQVSTNLKHLTKSDDTSRILSIEIFGGKPDKISHCARMENLLLSNFGEIILNLLTSDCVVLKHEALQLIQRYSKTPLRDKIIQYLLKNFPAFKSKYSNFLKSNPHHNVDIIKIGNFLKLRNLTVPHKCLEWRVEPKLKKFKPDENVHINSVLGKLREDVDNLKELLRTETLKTENTAAISSLIAELHLCLK